MLVPEIEKYIDDLSNLDDAVLSEIERSTHLHTLAPQMLSGRIQGKFLALLVRLINAVNVLEIGTFTGYGSVCLAQGLTTPEGKVVTIEANPEYNFLIQKHLALTELSNQIETVTGNALEIIPAREEIWDVVYIDAHKQEYHLYYDAVFPKVRVGGLILSDNVLWSGKVVFDPEDYDTKMINAYNQKLKDDPRVEVLVLPIRDGLSVARKLSD